MSSHQQRLNMQYCPHTEQLKFHAGMGIWPQRAALAGTGAGKTLCGLYEDIRWARDYPGSVGYIFEPNFPMIRRILLPTLSSPQLLGEPFTQNLLIARYSKMDQMVEWKNGSQWWFVSLDDPERSEGPNVDYAHIDEARLVLHFGLAWQTILRRLRGSGRCKVPIKPGVWLTTTPSAPQTELYDAVENPKTKSPNCHVYRWSLFDNPKLPKAYVEEMVRTHTGGLADRFIWGRFAAVGGGTFAFDSSVHVREIEFTLIKEVRYGVDFGWTNPTAILAVGYDGDGRIWVLDEVYQRQLKKEVIIEALLAWKVQYGAGSVICDPSNPETIDALRTSGLDAVGHRGKREDGIRELGGRFPKAGDGQPRIFISKKCVNLISELLEYRENVKENDHAVDAIRYSLKSTGAPPGVGAVMLPHDE